jgi:hypothetical protein
MFALGMFVTASPAQLQTDVEIEIAVEGAEETEVIERASSHSTTSIRRCGAHPLGASMRKLRRAWAPDCLGSCRPAPRAGRSRLRARHAGSRSDDDHDHTA